MIDNKDLQYSFSSLLGAETIIRRQKRNEKLQKKNQFISIIKKYDEALTKSMMIEAQFQIDMSKYEDIFYSIIDEIFILSYGDNIYQLIAFFFYERRDPITGEEQYIVGENGEEIFIRTPEDLFNTIERIYPGTFT